ncbi:phage capsid protein [Escherichia coli]|nr:phage capsid protein [Escherichia coli]
MGGLNIPHLHVADIVSRLRGSMSRNRLKANTAGISDETRRALDNEYQKLERELELHTLHSANGEGNNNGIERYNRTAGSVVSQRNQQSQIAFNLAIESITGKHPKDLHFSDDTARYSSEVEPVPRQSATLASGWQANFLAEITPVPVTDISGRVVLVDASGPLARTSPSHARRSPLQAHSLVSRGYRCEQVNFDFALNYDNVDAHASANGLEGSARAAFERRKWLDLIQIGFNGTHYADTSDPGTYPGRDDCGVGWLQKFRNEAAGRVISGLSVSSPKSNTRGTHHTIDALVLDAWQSMIDEQWQEGIVAVCSHNTLVRKQWPLINRLDPSQMNQEIFLNEEIIKNPVLGNLPAVTVPFFPDNAVLITPLANLCLYWQRGSVRGLVKNEPQYNRLAFYESCNLDWVVGQYEAGCLLDGIDWKE